MSPTTSDLELFFRTNLARLDETIRELTAELQSLRERQILPGDSFASQFDLARRAADEVRNKVTDLARELGREAPAWTDRVSLEAVVCELLAARVGHAQARERLQRVAGQLEEGRFVHKIRRTAERLNVARLKAAAEVRQQAIAAQPASLPGPDDGSDWLTWAWSLEPAPLDQLSDQLQAAYPTLADLLPEAERWQSSVSLSPAPGGEPNVFVPPFPPPPDPAVFHPREPPAEQVPPAREVPAAVVEAPPSLTAADSVSAGSLVVGEKGTKALKAEPAPPSAPLVATLAAEPPSTPPLVPAPQDSHEQATRSAPQPTVLKGRPVSQEPEVTPDAVVGVVASDAPALDPGRLDADHKLIWLLLEQDRPGLAYHLATCLQRLARGAACLPAALPYAIALSPLVSSSGGEVVENLRDYISNLQDYVTDCEAEQGEEAQAVRVLLLVAMLRLALLAPSSAAGSLLAALVDGESPLALLGRAVLDYTSHGQRLTPALLSGVRAQAAWEDMVRQACEAARTWLVDNRQSHLIYAHTTTVWREWLRDGGILGRPLSFIITNDRTHGEEVRDAVKSWSLKRDVDNRLARTDKQLRKGGARQRPIIARAQTAVFEHAQEFVALAQRWLDSIAAEPSDANDYRFRQAEECRGRLKALLNPAQQAVNEVGTAAGDHVALRAASAVAMRLLAGLAQLIDPDAQEETATPPLRYVLHRELLGLPWLTLNERWEPEEADVERLLSELERLAAMEPADLRQAFAARAGARDHGATGWVLDALAWAGVPESELQDLRAQDEQKLQQCRLALRRKLEETRDNIERAVCYDLIDEATRSDYLARVENVAVEEVMVFGPEEAQLREIDETLAASRTKRIREVEQNPVMATIAREHPDAHDRIQEALHRQDFLTAEEYIRLAQAGQTLDGVAVQGRDILKEFFPDFAGQWHTFFSGAGSRPAIDLRQILEDVRAGRSVGPLSMRGVPAPQTREAANMLQAWFRLKERSRTPKDHLRDLLSTFGFKVHDVQLTDGGEDSHWLADVRTEPLADRADCLVPQFGSLAKGQYRVLCLNERLSEDRMIDLARKYSPHGPLLALYLGRMTEQRRRDLAEMCWRKHRTFLVIDEAMVFFLCGERFKRLPVLCGCAFPFTVAEPYTTTSSLVPIEMFYGRDREREEVIKPSGSNLVYGGRQLGKTALLRDVERRYRDVDRGMIVRYIDLTHGESIGVSRPAEDIWEVIGHALAEDKVFAKQRTNPRSVAEGVKEWLGQDDKRRIVLLLDEADAFLDSDSRKVTEQTMHTFPNVSKLKAIMEDNDRRFKVVFAGLHNVQRTARDSNSPIPHLDSAICIGPLLEQGEWREARALVERPLRNLGYRFETDDLPLRILSHTNFYPSLIQIFCKGLLKRLQDANRTFFDFKTCPPYTVTAGDVDATYHDVRGEIRHRFDLTLNLDTRYKLIALCIAHASIEQRPERALVEGFDVGWVRDNATYWWAKGFAKDSSFEAFRTVLDEMVGLGVLRKTGGDRYALRSSNLLNLLGSKEQIAQALLDVTETVPPPEYEAATFRRTRREDPWLRSPLTAQQESELLVVENGVAVLFGSAMSGLGRVIDFLRETCDQSLLRVPERVTDFQAFEAALRDIKADGPEGVFLLVFGPECGWSERWVESAVDYLRPKTSSKKRFLRVLFLGDPQAAWEWGQLEDCRCQKLANAGVRELSLHPWREPAIRRWMLDAGFGPHDNPEGCREFLRVTGGWDALVLKIGELCHDSPHNWKDHVRALEETWKTDSAWLARFGLVQATLPVLRDLAVLDEPFSTGDAADLLGRPDDDPTLAQSLAWADRLQYARKVEQGKWLLDDVVCTALRAELAK